jgi:hypothetical protein
MAQRTKARFYPTSPQIQTPPLSQSYHLTGSGSASQAPRSRGATPDPDGWNLVEGKRRRVIQARRPFGAQNKLK